MNRCPKIGDRVRYKGGLTTGPCEGVVRAIYESEEWDKEADRPMGKLAPESEWAVGVEVDPLPAKWCYPKTNRFAPSVKDVEIVKGGAEGIGGKP
jgi:hypothetical protein